MLSTKQHIQLHFGYLSNFVKYSTCIKKPSYQLQQSADNYYLSCWWIFS